MSEVYELIDMGDGAPIKISIVHVNELKLHWHDELEILFILKGSINLIKGKKKYLLKEEDVVVINSGEAHQTSSTKEDNIVLALQIQPDYYNRYYSYFSNMRFDCNSAVAKIGDQDKFNPIRKSLAEIVWEINKKLEGYELRVGSQLNQLSFHLMNNFNYDLLEGESREAENRNRKRIGNILEYINSNLGEKLTLASVAEREGLSPYYLSHYFKGEVGLSFQEYINTIRLKRAVQLLGSTNDNITDIALKCGFSSTNYFNRVFRQTYKTTPSQYRRANLMGNRDMEVITEGDKRTRSYFDVNRKAAFERLFKYLDMGDENKEEQALPARKSGEAIEVNLQRVEGKRYRKYWMNLINFGRAAEGLRVDVQGQLREMQEEIPFKYVRFHGIFNDDMMIYDLDNKGNPSYNWTYVNQLFDFFQAINIKPFVELGLMPGELKSSGEVVHWWKGNISPPKDIKLWAGLVKEFIKHCINRYGIEEVKTWYFEVWNEPELEYVFWAGTREEYFEFFQATALAVKSISPDLKIGGPAISHGTLARSTWLKDFLQYVKANQVPLDFISNHIYPEYVPEEEFTRVKKLSRESNTKLEFKDMRSIYYGEDHTLKTIELVTDKVYRTLGYNPELHISEWNGSSLLGNLIHDTAYISTYIVKNVLDCIGTVNSLGYWALTDIFEEEKLRPAHFHGGFGLINKDGIKKASYYAYYLLNKLGQEIIKQDKDYIITKNNDSYQILTYNFTYFDQLFKSGDTSALFHKNRYEIYEDKPRQEREFKLEGLAGRYKITRYELNRENGSAYDNWVQMGGPENMTREEVDYLKGVSRPKTKVKVLDIENQYIIKSKVPAHGIELIILDKML